MSFNAEAFVRKNIPNEVRTILLGESTHGTQEFYVIRADICRYLVERRGYKIIVVEADWPLLWHVNLFVRRQRLTMFPKAEDIRFPKWMWRNQPFIEFVGWLRSKQRTDVWLLGMDCYCKEESKQEVMQYLDRVGPKELTKEFRSSCYPVERPNKWQQVLAKIQWGKSDRRHQHDESSDGENESDGESFLSEWDRFNAEQNLECMIAADEYYNVQRMEPPGSQASWNARDQHMATTILRLKATSQRLFKKSEVRIAVWAHNSHVGDAIWSPRGGVDFGRNETWNLGQMLRASLGSATTRIIGFYTYQGRVRASNEWGEPGVEMDLNPALASSLEGYLHNSYPKQTVAISACPDKRPASPTLSVAPTGRPEGVYRPILPNHRTIQGSIVPTSGVHAVSRKTLHDGRVLLKLENEESVVEFDPRGGHISFLMRSECDAIFTPGKENDICYRPCMQRWVGVVYKPKHEVESHYGEIWPLCSYDHIIFVDESSAVKLDTESRVNISPNANERLLREYQRIRRQQTEGIWARPLDENILEWHFCLLGTEGSAYEKGQYHGVLEFPTNFPMGPPSIRFFTPSGRFAIDSRVCLTMSDFHRELWNPAWSVEKILLGILSFLYEDSPGAIGSLTESRKRRLELAAQSSNFNRRNELFVYLFSDYLAGLPIENLGDEDDDGPSCRFCYGLGGLVTPCECRGSNAFVHERCLRQWQRSVLLTQSTHPKFQRRIDEFCDLCESLFKPGFEPISRHQTILSFTGRGLVQSVRKGSIFVSSQDHSDRIREMISLHPDASDDLKHWLEAVLLVYNNVDLGLHSSSGDGSGVLAVNLNNGPLSQPPEGMAAGPRWLMKGKVSSKNIWTNLLKGKPDSVKEISHWLGGPCEPHEAFGLVEVPPDLRRVYETNGELLLGSLYLREMGANFWTSIPPETTSVRVIWGYAGWGTTQFIAEVAKRSWGVVRATSDLVGDLTFDNWTLNWSALERGAAMAPESEYSKTH